MLLAHALALVMHVPLAPPAATPPAPAPTPPPAAKAEEAEAETLFVGALRSLQVEPNLVGILTDLLTHELAMADDVDVVSARDVEVVANKSALNQTVGCNDEKCQIDLARSVNARFLVGGTVGKVEDLYVITLDLMDLQSMRVLRRVKAQVNGTDKDLVALMEQAAPRLLTGKGRVVGEVGVQSSSDRAQALAEFESVAESYDKGGLEYMSEKTLIARIGDQLTKKKAAVKDRPRKKKKKKS